MDAKGSLVPINVHPERFELAVQRANGFMAFPQQQRHPVHSVTNTLLLYFYKKTPLEESHLDSL